MARSPRRSARPAPRARSAPPWAATRSPIIIPCHRVLAAGGKSGGFSAPGGTATKFRMLAIEGAKRPGEPELFESLPLALAMADAEAAPAGWINRARHARTGRSIRARRAASGRPSAVARPPSARSARRVARSTSTGLLGTRRDPALAPLAQREQDREQIEPLFGQAVGDAPAVGRVRLALQDPVLDQPGKPVREDVAGDAEGRLEFLEMLEAVEGAAQDQERPAFAHRLERGRDRASPQHLAMSFDIQHEAILIPFRSDGYGRPTPSCNMILTGYKVAYRNSLFEVPTWLAASPLRPWLLPPSPRWPAAAPLRRPEPVSRRACRAGRGAALHRSRHGVELRRRRLRRAADHQPPGTDCAALAAPCRRVALLRRRGRGAARRRARKVQRRAAALSRL